MFSIPKINGKIGEIWKRPGAPGQSISHSFEIGREIAEDVREFRHEEEAPLHDHFQDNAYPSQHLLVAVPRKKQSQSHP